ncbi:uncharacterized protein SPPG_04945 [Spizellomyces punctatus DAOM BR117]|uniref:DM2 domain-containing protein n=1 Tax=Spizellomyces punctatus (strain DAOM BR117) TaxID=645134 RepID=A0A0L0HEV9_SPIPD|nr:uncharacterized protein SPPG_04945 [Spizellomyces punctatus DAOM BR117]KNC99556.1 hypothetical protein SPPG_04945 [Spizellomyces punctatus DAOM BR117]|eukprot:XP_016607596.1 hypothetical protein SPPG_04945 [Spizellomyces punctatus DAOM BR117]
MSELNLAKYSVRIRDILSNADLDTTTAKSVRRQLEQEYNVDLSPWKKEVDACILDILDELERGDENDEVGEMVDESIKEEKSKDEVKEEQKVKQEDLKTFLSPPPDKPVPVKRKNGADVNGSRKKVKSEDFVFSDEDELEESLEATAGDEELARQLQREEDTANRRTRRSGTASTPSTKKKSTAKRASSKPSAFTRPVVLSPALSTFVGGATEMPRHTVVKLLWAYIKEHDLQDPNDKRYILVDDALRPVFGSRQRVGMFGMNKILSKHMMKSDEVVGGRTFGSVEDDDDLCDSEVEKVKSPKPRAKKARKSGNGLARTNNAFHRPWLLSPELAALLGKSELPRPQVVKGIWDYVKGNDLQDPSNRKFILCDAALQKVFKTDRVSGFGMNSLLSQHLMKKEIADSSDQKEEMAEDDPEKSVKTEDDLSDEYSSISDG